MKPVIYQKAAMYTAHLNKLSAHLDVTPVCEH